MLTDQEINELGAVNQTIKRLVQSKVDDVTRLMSVLKDLVKECEVIVNGISGDQGNYCVTINSVGANNKIPAIKAIRTATQWGLREAKEFSDGIFVGKPMTLTLPLDKAISLCASITSDGGNATLRQC